jgi:hypothetical protein
LKIEQVRLFQLKIEQWAKISYFNREVNILDLPPEGTNQTSGGQKDDSNGQVGRDIEFAQSWDVDQGNRQADGNFPRCSLSGTFSARAAAV